ncbi:putative amidoligase enzyme-domain-containing protein [Hypomontagnella monticulosa]|nr:putative amidoligase enzyme-domain-containing protein [Hypomontagnella monticulosa]
MAQNHNGSSFGVEIEFVIAVIIGDDEPGIPERFEHARGRPIRLQPDVRYQGETYKRIREVINGVLEDFCGNRVLDGLTPDEIQRGIGQPLLPYRDWIVKNDPTVLVTREELGERHISEYGWQSVEITSPALWATDRSFEEVHRVVTALSEHFWVFSPETAGLHVHYGRGLGIIPIRELRRIAAFLYAADPVLVRMHAPRRSTEEWCPSNRLYSAMANGIPPEEMAAYVDRNYRYDVPPPTEPPERVAQPDARRVQTARGFVPLFQRGILDGYVFDVAKFIMLKSDFITEDIQEFLPGSHPDRPLAIRTAASAFLRSRDYTSIALYNQSSFADRMAYNFHRYVDGYDLESHTIEFRQPAGTVNADEVVAHARISVRLADYASSAPLPEIWMLILDLAQSEYNSEWYDVFDLLADLGLHEEARVIERQVAREHGIEVDDTIWEIRRSPYSQFTLNQLVFRLAFLSRPQPEGEFVVYRDRPRGPLEE